MEQATPTSGQNWCRNSYPSAPRHEQVCTKCCSVFIFTCRGLPAGIPVSLQSTSPHFTSLHLTSLHVLFRVGWKGIIVQTCFFSSSLVCEHAKQDAKEENDRWKCSCITINIIVIIIIIIIIINVISIIIVIIRSLWKTHFASGKRGGYSIVFVFLKATYSFPRPRSKCDSRTMPLFPKRWLHLQWIGMNH